MKVILLNRLALLGMGVFLGAMGAYWAGTSVRETPPMVTAVPAARPPVRIQMPPPSGSRSAGPEAPEPAMAGDAATKRPAARTPAAEIIPEAGPPPTAPPSEALRQFTEVFSLTEGEERMKAFQQLVASISPANAALYHKAWMQGPYMQADSAMNQAYNGHIGQVYGAGVVGPRDGYGPKDMMGAYTFVKDQFHGWIQTDPAAAEKWLDGLAHPEFRAAMEKAWDEAAKQASPTDRNNLPGNLLESR